MNSLSAQLNRILKDSVPTVTPALQLVVLQHGKTIYDQAAGWLDPETRQRPVRRDTRFDLASVTKLFVTTALMTLCDAGQVDLRQPVSTVLPEFSGKRPIQPYEHPLQKNEFVSLCEEGGEIDAGQITFTNLLTHRSGLPAWRPLFRQADAAHARRMATETFFSYPTNQHIVYSDIGLILIGLALERLTGQPLQEVIRDRVLTPLELRHTRYYGLPQRSSAVNVAPTEFCQWRHRRIVGEVHDENAARLGGVSGHAGLFSTARDVARFGQLFLEGGSPILHAETVAEMSRLHAEEGAVRRGIGFVLWSPDPEASGNPFSQQAFGHTGFTGTSLWIDPVRQLVVALLTNEVYYGRENRKIASLRVNIHRVIVEGLTR